MRYRLAMWELSPSRRGKSPMPPALSVTARAPSARPWPESDDFRVIREFLQRDGPYTAAGLPLDGADYETLPPCVSERARATGSGIRNPSLAATVERALP
jgi:hypothetical protein